MCSKHNGSTPFANTCIIAYANEEAILWNTARPHQVFTPSALIPSVRPMSLTQLTQGSHGKCPLPSSDENGSRNTCSMHKNCPLCEPARGRTDTGIANTRQDEHENRMATTHKNRSSNCKFNTSGSPALRTKSDTQSSDKYLYPHCAGTAVWPQTGVPKNEGFLGSRNHLIERVPLASHPDRKTQPHDHKRTCENCSPKTWRLLPT